MDSHQDMYDRKTNKPYFELGMGFTDIDEAREAVRKHAIKENKDVMYKKNEPKRIRLVCKYRGCKWTFFASLNKKYNIIQIKKLKKHGCPNHFKKKWISSALIVERYRMRIRSNPRWKNKYIREAVREDFRADVSLMQCSRAKGLVLHWTMKCYTDEYALVRTYAEAILRTNPGSTVKIKVDVDNPENQQLFQRMYVCFDALKKGFLAGCRKVIALDGSFLKGMCKGEILSVIGRDANEQMYPIAWCIVEVESRSSWEWFLERLTEDLDIQDGLGWCFSSDQQKGLLPCVESLFPKVEHRLCARHIYSNWRKKFKNNAWQKMFWKCAKATTEAFFIRAKEKLAAVNLEGAAAMVHIHPKHWSRAYFSTEFKCDSVDNNLSESFNALILEARHKPIYSMLEDIHIMCMETIATKRLLARKWKSDICPKILRKLAKNAEKTRFCNILSNGKDGYEVSYKANRFWVHLEEKKWDITGIPCTHAIPYLLSEGKEPADYVASWFSVDKYWLTYNNVMEPMDGPKSWIKSLYDVVQPPKFRIMPGRPKKKRIQSAEEKEDGKKKKQRRVYTKEELLTRDKHDRSKLGRVGRVIRCKFCGEDGHNKKTCYLFKETQVNARNGVEGNEGPNQKGGNPGQEIQT